MLIFYATYYPIQRPWCENSFYSSPDPADGDSYEGPITHDETGHHGAHDHKRRDDWYSRTSVYLEKEQFVELTDVTVCANGFLAGLDKKLDIGDALKIIFADNEPDVEQFLIDASSSIRIDPFTTKLAAAEQLCSLWNPRNDETAESPASQICWGFWEDSQFIAKEHMGHITIPPTIPGVTIDATRKQEGAIVTCTVVYTDKIGGDEDRVLNAWVPKKLTVDRTGEVVSSGDSTAVADASGLAHNENAAADNGVTTISKLAEGSWEGTISLRSITGTEVGLPEGTPTAAIKAGNLLEGGVDDELKGALVTSVSVDVDSDTVTLSLGGTGYIGRFPEKTPGSATPIPERTVKRFNLS
jgi:hypothetical protein